MFADAPFGERPFAALEDIYYYCEPSSELRAVLEFRIFAATRQWATAPDDTPSNRPFRGTLRQPLHLRRSILGATIGVFNQASGELVIDNSDAFYDFLVEDYGIDGRDIIVKVGRTSDAYEDWVVLFRGTAADWTISEDSLTILLRDNAYRLNVPAQPTLYGGTGGSDGGSDLGGQRKPRAFGEVLNIEPPLVVPSLLIYQVNDGEIDDVEEVYDRGAALTFSADYASYALLAAATTSAGYYDTCLAEGFIKLGSQPDGTVTADVMGDKAGGVYVETTGGIVRRLLATAAELSDPDDLDTASFTLLDAAQPAPVGYWLGPGASESVGDVIANLMGGIGGWGGFKRDGTFEVQRFEAPAGTLAGAFDRTSIIEITREPLPEGSVPPWRQRVAYDRVWTVQTDLAGSVSATRKAFVAAPFRLAEASDTAVLTDHPMARDPDPIQSYYTDEDDAGDEAERLVALYATVRALYRMKLGRTALTLDLGDVIEVTYPRWALASGRSLRVVEISYDLSISGSVEVVEVVGYG